MADDNTAPLSPTETWLLRCAIKAARERIPTPDEVIESRVSFAYGNLLLTNEWAERSDEDKSRLRATKKMAVADMRRGPR